MPFLTATSFVLFLASVGWISLSQALLIGAAVGLVNNKPLPAAGRSVSRWLLQGCIVLLGLNMDLPAVFRAGASGIVMGAGTVAITLLAGWLLGRWLKLRLTTATLLSAGTAICGGSAIAAVGSVIDAEPADLSVSLGAVFLLNAAALYVFPAIGHALHLSPARFGTWAGIGIHDVSSVVGAAARYDPAALPIATAVKLSRSLWIIPLTLGISLARRRAVPAAANATFGFEANRAKSGAVTVPYFAIGFVLAAAARTAWPSLTTIGPAASRLATIGLTLALFLIGASISRRTLAAVGGRALVHAGLLWLLIGSIGLAAAMG